MNAKHHRSMLSAVAIVCTLLAPLCSYAGPLYSVTMLPNPSGGNLVATAINNGGQVTGTQSVTQSSSVVLTAFLYSNGSMQNLGNLGGTYQGYTGGGGYAINDSGQVTGASFVPNSSPGYVSHAFLYSNGSMQDLGASLGGANSAASGINNNGQITGETDVNGIDYRAFIYGNGKLQQLGTLGGNFSIGRGINASGEVVGNSTISNGTTTHAFLYSNGSMKDLGTLGGANSGASAINASGEVVGTSETATDGAGHAFLYSSGSMKDLGALAGDFSEANAINDIGQIVGDSSYNARNSGARAFIYSDGQMINLNAWAEVGGVVEHDFTFVDAVGINDKGQIIVNGIINKTGQDAAFLLTPLSQTVSEPGTLALLGAGLVGLGFALRRRASHLH